MAQRLIDPTFRAVNSLGIPISGACLYIYEAGTDNAISTYSEYTLTTPNSNPVESNGVGLFPDIFVAPDDYKVIYTDGSGTSVLTDVTLDTWDNINISAASSLSGGINAAGYTEHLVNSQTGTTYTYLTGDRGKKVVHSNIASIAGTLPQANSTTFANGWYYTAVNEGAGLLTITPTTSTIGGEATLVLTRGQSAEITSDGTDYHYEIKGEPVGSEKTWYTSTPPHGWLIQNGDTIGSAGSGATKTGAKYRALYAHLYALSDSYAPVSTGRGASANADFDANKTITIPTMVDKSAHGVGTYAAGQTAGAATVTSTGTIGASGATTLSSSQIPALTYTLSMKGSNVGSQSAHSYLSDAASTDTAPDTTATAAITTNAGGGSHTHASGTYTGDATNVLHPVRNKYHIMKY